MPADIVSEAAPAVLSSGAPAPSSDSGPSSPAESSAAPPPPSPATSVQSSDGDDGSVADEPVNPPDFGLQPFRPNGKSTGGNKKAGASTTKGFNVSQWDGDIQKLPEDVRDFVDVLSRHKFSAIEAEFKAKQAELEKAFKAEAKNQPGADAKVDELQRELELYKLLAEGAEDPRVADLGKKATEWEQKYTQLNKQFEAMQAENDNKWVADFKAKHSDIFADKAKTAQLMGFINKGWDEEAAAMLVGASDELIRTATDLVKQHKLGYDGHSFAIQHAKMKLGTDVGPRKPRPAADITSGAQGQRNSSRVPGGSLRELPRHEARAEAARIALAVDNRRKA